MGRWGRLLRAKVASWMLCACRSAPLVLPRKTIKVKTTWSFGAEDPVSAAAVVDTGAGPSGSTEDLLPTGWLLHAWHEPSRSRIVDSSGRALNALARLRLTQHVHDKRMHLPLFVV